MMMTDVLRKQWGFNGFVVTDYASIAEILQHGTAKTSRRLQNRR